MDPLAQQILSELPANIGSALALVPALEWAKRSDLPWLKKVNAATAPYIAGIASFALAFGIHATVSCDGAGNCQAMMNWSVAGLAGGALDVAKQWLGQHWTYKLYQAFDTVKSVAVAINKQVNVPTGSVTGADGKP